MTDGRRTDRRTDRHSDLLVALLATKRGESTKGEVGIGADAEKNKREIEQMIFGDERRKEL